jgi:acyl transferase domain-containing protein
MMPIAIIGISCRFPGDGFDPENFWQMLLDGRSARTEIPKSRFNIDGFHHPDPDRLGTVSITSQHFRHFASLKRINHRG